MKPFIKAKTGKKGFTKYVQHETGSWVTFNPNGDCHLGAYNHHVGTLPEVAGQIQQSKEYAEGFRFAMLHANRERDEAYAYIHALWKTNQLPQPMPVLLRDKVATYEPK